MSSTSKQLSHVNNTGSIEMIQQNLFVSQRTTSSSREGGEELKVKIVKMDVPKFY